MSIRPIATRKALVRARKATELGMAVPQVVGHRLARLAAAGPHPSARDQHEFFLMGEEKVVAFTEAWLSASMTMWQANLTLGASLLGVLTAPTSGRAYSRLVHQWQAAVADTLDAGLAPIHETATANARRLARDAVALRRTR